MLEGIPIEVSHMKAVRLLRAWSLDEVVKRSRRLGFATDRGEVSKLERGLLPLSRRKAQQFAAVFEVQPEVLLEPKASQSPQDTLFASPLIHSAERSVGRSASTKEVYVEGEETTLDPEAEIPPLLPGLPQPETPPPPDEDLKSERVQGEGEEEGAAE